MRDERVNWFSKFVTVLAYTFILAPMIIIVIISSCNIMSYLKLIVIRNYYAKSKRATHIGIAL